MPYFLETLASVATIAGTIISILALLHSRAWLVLVSLVFVCLSVFAGLSAKRDRLSVKAASIVIEGRSIDSLNMANLKRRVNRTFLVREAQHTAQIEDEDLKITWTYSGYCRVPLESAIEFSIDSHDSTPFEKLDCVAYDLENDPDMIHEIRPLLVSTDGMSKKISVPFLAPLKAHESFRILLMCTFRRAMTEGFGYYISTLSFAQDRVGSCVVRLVFVGPAPKWLRVYECTPQGKAVLLKSLAPSRKYSALCEYIDEAEDRAGQSARVYAFWRDSV